jgi:hypothetical protein
MATPYGPQPAIAVEQAQLTALHALDAMIRQRAIQLARLEAGNRQAPYSMGQGMEMPRPSSTVGALGLAVPAGHFGDPAGRPEELSLLGIWPTLTGSLQEDT